tara:strand:+ start:478 stop:1647 length:1170 start_codon:yes stop_codon:yes gene_type:complete
MSKIIAILVIFSTVFLTGAGRQQEIVITFGGDVCLNRNGLKSRPDGTKVGGRLVSWEKLASGIKPLIDGDLNFLNLETVVTGRNQISARGKKFVFRSHPKGVEYLAEIGFNLMSLANNHAFDFGVEGVKETLKHSGRLTKTKGVYFAGLGNNDAEAIEPVVFEYGGHTFAFGAVGIITNMRRNERATPERPGMVGFRFKGDYERVLDAMAAVKADYKILSIHYGTERQVKLDRGQQARFQRAVRKAGVDLVLGHHAHVVRAVERKKNKLIFYGLGNYLIRGARNMEPFPDAQDYGLFGRLYLAFNEESGRLEAQAVEAVALTGMHYIARPRKAEGGARRIKVLNDLSRRSVGDSALTFEVRRDGTGIACFGSDLGPRAKKRCGSSETTP